MLPILGPSTVRDAPATLIDRVATPGAIFEGTGTQIGLTVLQLVQTRAGLLGATRVIDEISLDKYTFIRDAYLQRRRSLGFDGDEPQAPPPPEGPAPAAAGGAAANLAGPAGATTAAAPAAPAA